MVNYQKIFLILNLLISGQCLAGYNDAELSVWVNEAIVSTYTFNYSNFLQRQQQIAKYFTSQGWINYSTALQSSNLPETVKKNAYFVSSVAALPPTIKPLTKQSWQAVMPLIVLYKNPQYQQKQHLEVTLNFQTAPNNQGVRGLVINSLQTKITTPACRCEKTEPKIAIA